MYAIDTCTVPCFTQLSLSILSYVLKPSQSIFMHYFTYTLDSQLCSCLFIWNSINCTPITPRHTRHPSCLSPICSFSPPYPCLKVSLPYNWKFLIYTKYNFPLLLREYLLLVIQGNNSLNFFLPLLIPSYGAVFHTTSHTDHIISLSIYLSIDLMPHSHRNSPSGGGHGRNPSNKNSSTHSKVNFTLLPYTLHIHSILQSTLYVIASFVNMATCPPSHLHLPLEIS